MKLQQVISVIFCLGLSLSSTAYAQDTMPANETVKAADTGSAEMPTPAATEASEDADMNQNMDADTASPSTAPAAQTAADVKTVTATAVDDTETPVPTVETEAQIAEPEVQTQEADWTWMTVAGWSALGVGTVATIIGLVVLSNQSDNLQLPLGLGSFSAGALIGVGGAVLLYLDSEG